jgi:ribosomal protein S4
MVVKIYQKNKIKNVVKFKGRKVGHLNIKRKEVRSLRKVLRKPSRFAVRRKGLRKKIRIQQRKRMRLSSFSFGKKLKLRRRVRRRLHGSRRGREKIKFLRKFFWRCKKKKKRRSRGLVSEVFYMRRKKFFGVRFPLQVNRRKGFDVVLDDFARNIFNSLSHKNLHLYNRSPWLLKKFANKSLQKKEIKRIERNYVRKWRLIPESVSFRFTDVASFRRRRYKKRRTHFYYRYRKLRLLFGNVSPFDFWRRSRASSGGVRGGNFGAFLGGLELRIDMVLSKLFFNNDVFECHRFLRKGIIYVNSKLVQNPDFIVKPFELIRFRLGFYRFFFQLKFILALCRKRTQKFGNIFAVFPKNMEFNFKIFGFMYLPLFKPLFFYSPMRRRSSNRLASLLLSGRFEFF